MDVNVNMSAEEFEEYLAYKKEKKAIKLEVSEAHANLATRHETLCAAVLDAFGIDGDADTPNKASDMQLADAQSALCSVLAALDWFC